MKPSAEDRIAFILLLVLFLVISQISLLIYMSR